MFLFLHINERIITNIMKSNNIIEVNEMIDLLDEFITSSKRAIIIGGCCGTNITEIAIESALSQYINNECLIVEGCQDMVGIYQNINKNCFDRHIFYAEMFQSVVVDGINTLDEFKPMILQPKPEYQTIINYSLLSKYKCIIVRDTHLIPAEYIRAIQENFNGKIIFICDPFDIGGMIYQYAPTIIDSLTKMSLTLALARNVYEIETRSIDKSFRCSVCDNKKINQRSIGKIDSYQYISDDESLIQMVRSKQLDNRFRKHHKLILSGDKIYNRINENGKIIPLTRNSMFTVQTSSENPMIKLKLHSSPDVFMSDVSYLNDAPEHMLPVNPSNIISIDESRHHMFRDVMCVFTSSTVNKSTKYSLLKNSVNLTIAKI